VRRLRLPTAVWLTSIVALAALFRGVLGGLSHIPEVLGDELIYEGLAKGWALQGEPVLRGSLTDSSSVFYPLLVAPAFRLAANGASALAAARVINAVAMATTALPAYVFARRVVPRGWALGVAALTVMVPWTMYAALILTESLFYPVFVAYAAVLVWTLERPTARRQAALLGILAFLVGVRGQGLTVALGTVVAILICGYFTDEGLLGTVRRFLPTLVVFGAAATIGIGASRAGVTMPASSYNILFHSLSQIGGILKWGVWNLALFEFPLGIVTLAAFPVAAWGMLRRDAAPVVRSTAAVTIGLSLSVLASVALLSASPFGLGRLHERNLFYVTPLLLTCVARWLQGGMRRPVVLSAVSAVACVALAWVLPQRLIENANNVDVPSAYFLLSLDARFPSVSFRTWVMIIAVVGAATFLVARNPVFPIFAIVLAFAAVTATVVYGDSYDARQVSELAWVDHTLPSGANASLVYLGAQSPSTCTASSYQQFALTVYAEWFNTHLTDVEYIDGANPGDGLPPPAKLMIGRGGVILEGRKPFRPAYVVLDSRQAIFGQRLKRYDLARLEGDHAADGASLTLWRVDPPLRFKLSKFTGLSVQGRRPNLIPNGEFDYGVDGWSGNSATETITAGCLTSGWQSRTTMDVTTSGHPLSGAFLISKIGVQSGGTYVFAFYAEGASGQTIRPTLEWSSSAAARPSTFVRAAATRLTGALQLVVLTARAPRGSTEVTPAILLGGAPTTTLQIDSVYLARGPLKGAFTQVPGP
jgi:hypothetical protein